MTFFYDLNKKLADIEAKSESKPLTESAVAEIAHDTGKKLLSKGERSELATQARAGKHIGHPGKKFKDVAAAAAKRYGSKEAGERVAAAAMFKGAAKHESATNEVWGGGDVAVMERDMDESALQAYLGKKKYGDQGMKALQKAGREHAGKEKMDKIRAQYDKMDEQMADEGNAFTAKLKTTPKGGEFELDGKKYKDTSDLDEGTYDPALDAPRFTIKDRDILEKLMKVYHQDLYHLRSKSGADGDVVYGTSPQLIQALQGLAQRMPGKVAAMEGAKPDFLDLDKDGNRTEPMKKAAQDRKRSVAEGVMSEIDSELREIVANQDFDALYNLFSANTPAGRYVQNIYNDVAIDNRLHPDDDFERIEKLVFDRLEDQFGEQGVAEGEGSKSSPYEQGGTDAWYHRGFDPEAHGYRPGTEEYREYKRGFDQNDFGPQGGKQY